MKFTRKTSICFAIICFLLFTYEGNLAVAAEDELDNEIPSLNHLGEEEDIANDVELQEPSLNEASKENTFESESLPEVESSLQESNLVEPEHDLPSTNDSSEVEEIEQESFEVEENPDAQKEEQSQQKASTEIVEPLLFQEGDRHDSIIELKVKLNTIGFDRISETNYYGSWTTTRVKQFQANYGLPVTGIADEITQEKLDEVYTSPFQVGGSLPDIIPLKEKLNAMGFDKISLTENYGNWTKTRVSEFQRFVGLKDNGIADAYTRQKLDEFVVKGFGKGERHHSLVEMKQMLNKLGFDGISETTLYGSWTATRVKQFQEYVGLPVTGRADMVTLTKLNEMASTPFQLGNRHSDTVALKEKLNRLGFGHITTTTLYGSFTEKQVRKFQKYYGLRVNGIADSVTVAKLDAIINSPFQVGVRHNQTPEIKEKLNRLGFGHITVTNLYGTFTEKQVKKFQSYYSLRVNGIVDEVTLNKINEIINSPLQKGKRSKSIISIKEDLNALGYDGISLTNYFGSWTETRLKQFQRDYGLPVSGIADPITVKTLSSKVVRIFLDPGHGGHDPGGSDYGLKEKNVVLDIALKTGKYLSKYIGVKFNYSRTTDVFVELEDRAEKANKWQADYFVSLHTNAYMRKGKGFETFIHDGKVSQETVKRQRDIHNYLLSKLKITNRGIKEANFNVLRNTNMPAILIEYMFIDNVAENKKLKDAKYRDWLGKITAEAIAKSFNLKKK